MYDDDEKDDGSFEADSPEPRRLFPVHQLHTPQMDTFCPGPLRRFLTPEAILKLDALDDWFLRVHISEHTAIDASPETPHLRNIQPRTATNLPFPTVR